MLRFFFGPYFVMWSIELGSHLAEEEKADCLCLCMYSASLLYGAVSLFVIYVVYVASHTHTFG